MVLAAAESGLLGFEETSFSSLGISGLSSGFWVFWSLGRLGVLEKSGKLLSTTCVFSCCCSSILALVFERALFLTASC